MFSWCCGGVFEQLARYTMRYQESDLHLALFFLIFLQLLLTQQVSRFYQLLYFYSTLTSSSIVAVLIAKAGHVWVS